MLPAAFKYFVNIMLLSCIWMNEILYFFLVVQVYDYGLYVNLV